MFPISNAFAAALSYPSSQSIITRADVSRAGVVLKSGLRILDGKVNVDSTADHRRTASVQIADPDALLTKINASATLAPYGNELTLYRGLQLVSGPELIPLGVFRIDQDQIEDNGDRTVEVDAYDRSWAVARARLEQPYVIAAGTDYGAAMIALLRFVLPGCPVDFVPTTGRNTPLIVLDEQSDPWKALTDMATSLGNEIFFDPLGTCKMRAQPDPLVTPPVWTYAEGSKSIVTAMKVQYQSDPGYNEFIAESNVTGMPPLRSIAQDTDPQSPTNIYGPYGRVPEFYSSDLMTTQAQCDAASAAGLLRNKGGTQIVTFNAVPNPAHEAEDIVTVIREAEAINAPFVLETFQIPMQPATMPVTCRKRQGQ